MHLNPWFKSNISSTSFFYSNLLSNIENNSKIFFLILFIFTDICSCAISFILAIYYMKVYLFASALTFDSESRKHLLAHWLNPTIWPPDGQGTKGPGKQIYVSETHSRIASLLSVCHHWGGEHRCYCILYLLIFLVVCNLGSIYSHIYCLPSLRSL